MSKEIKNTDFNPCPICGKDLKYHCNEPEYTDCLKCENCEIMFHWSLSGYELLNHWNKITKPRESVAWKRDFELYKKMAEDELEKLLVDKEFIERVKLVLGTSYDPIQSLRKSFKVFWGTEDGWANKKRKRTKKINWKSTYLGTVGINKVYYPRSFVNSFMDNSDNDGLVM